MKNKKPIEFLALDREKTKKDIDRIIRPHIYEVASGFSVNGVIYPSLREACKVVGEHYTFMPYKN